MKKIILTLMTIAALITAAYATSNVTVTEAGNFHILYNGAEKGFTDGHGTLVRPIVNSGTTYLPVRAVSELIGLSAGWNGETSTITLSSGQGSGCITTAPAPIAQQSVQAALADNFTIIYNDARQTFTDANGSTVYPLVINGTTYLPIRALCNMLSIPVEWEQSTSAIYLGTKPENPTPAYTGEAKSVAIPAPVYTNTNSIGEVTTVYAIDNSEGFKYLRITVATTRSLTCYTNPTLEDAKCGNVSGYAGFRAGGVDAAGYVHTPQLEKILDVSDCSTIYLASVVGGNRNGTITSLALENPAPIPTYSIPAGATALTDANTTFSVLDTTYSNGQFIRHNRGPGSHTPDEITFKNTGYTSITFTVITKEDAMNVQVIKDREVSWYTTQAPNTTATYTQGISGSSTSGMSTWGIIGNISGCDSIITNVYVQ